MNPITPLTGLKSAGLLLAILLSTFPTSSQQSSSALGPKKTNKPCRGIAVLSSSLGQKIKRNEIEMFVRECHIDLVVIDYSWITYHWPHTDHETVDNLVKTLQKSDVTVAAMYRPRALNPAKIKAHFARSADGTVPKHHNHLCFAHKDSIEWGLGWGTKILSSCPSLDRIILYNVLPLCRCKFCRGNAGKKHAAAFMKSCREKWKKIRKNVRIGHVGSGLEYARHVDFFCPFLSINRTSISRPVRVDRLVDAVSRLRNRAQDKPVVPLVKLCWTSATRNTTEDIVHTIRSCKKADLGFLLWYHGWIFHQETNRYDPEAVVQVLGGNWAKLETFFTSGKNRNKPAPRPGKKWWVYFPSKERREGKPPELAITPAAGRARMISVSRDVSLIKYLGNNVYGSFPQLAVGNEDQNRSLLAFDLPRSLRRKSIRKAELVLDLKLSSRPPRDSFVIAVHAVTGSWNEKITSWVKQPSFREEPILRAELAPQAGVVRWDVTGIVQEWLSGKSPNQGFLLKQGGFLSENLAARLLKTLPWENSADAALKRASVEKRLILACVRGVHKPDAEDLPELLLMAVAFANPDVVNLVKHRFVPVRVHYSPRTYTHGKSLGSRDPLARLGGDCTKIKAPALCVSTPGGKLLATLDTIGTFDAELIYRFLRQALKKSGKFSRPEAAGAEALLEAGALDRAKKAFKLLGSPGKEYGLSRVAALQGGHALAVRLAHAASGKKSILSADASVQGGVSLMRQGDRKRARKLLEDALDMRSVPTRAAEALYYLGCLHILRKDPDSADRTWRRLAREHPRSLWTLKAAARQAWPDRVGSAETLLSLHNPPVNPESTERPARAAEIPALIRRAITYLLDQQAHDGCWPSEVDQYRSAVTALIAKALLTWSDSPLLLPTQVDSPGTGPLRSRVESAVKLASGWLEAFLADRDAKVANSFGAAYLLDFFLARYARTQDPDHEKTVQRSIHFLLEGQCPDGAWSYSYKFGVNWKGGIGGWPRTNRGRTHSMNTGPALLNLARAKTRGFKVDAGAMKRAIRVLKKMRSDPGVYTYTFPEPINFQKPDQSIARGPVCEHALFACGAVGKKALRKTVQTFMKYRGGLRIPVKINSSWGNPHAFSSYFFFYAYYHAGLAIQELGPQAATPLLEKLRGDLLEVPELDSTWVDYHQLGKPYGTAMALLVLHMGKK